MDDLGTCQSFWLVGGRTLAWMTLGPKAWGYVRVGDVQGQREGQRLMSRVAVNEKIPKHYYIVTKKHFFNSKNHKD